MKAENVLGFLLAVVLLIWAVTVVVAILTIAFTVATVLMQ